MKPIHRLLGAALVAASLWACSPGTVRQADYNIIPKPQQVALQGGEPFQLTATTTIVYPEGNEAMAKNAAFLAEYIGEMTGMTLKTGVGTAQKGVIALETGLENANPEAYRLTVTADGVTIQGATDAAVFYGIQTLRKALAAPAAGEKTAEVLLPAVVIDDQPRFAYRGAHFDISRHFTGVDSMKRFIDMLALHNLNRLHWHITDDQGWRIEIKKHPRLTEVGSKRSGTLRRGAPGYDSIPYGGFYTQDEAREIVKYAADRHITVIPEIDLPGHMLAALTAYPSLGCTGGPYEVWKHWGVAEDVLCAGNDSTYQFIDDVLAEIVDIFPSEYIHIGGDECPKVRWEKCPKCQARIKELGLKADGKHTAEERLQSHVIRHAEKFLADRGRKIIGWDEIMEGGLAPTATVMAWRDAKYGIEAARQGNDAIMTPTSYLYFDYYQTQDLKNEPVGIGGYVPVEKVYSFEPAPSTLEPEVAKHIIGVQANLWTEYIPNFRHVEYMELPRMAALAEVQWTMPEKKDYADFLTRVPKMMQAYDVQGYNYATHLLDVNASFVPDTKTGAVDAVLFAIDSADIRYTLDGSEPTEQSALYERMLRIDKPATLKAAVFRPGGRGRMLSEEIVFNKATTKPITMLQPVNDQYRYKGEVTLVDGLRGNSNYKTGRWIAFWKNDMEAVIDLEQPTEISRAQIETCVAKGDWVFDAREFSIAVSDDGKTFREVAKAEYPAMAEEDKNGVHEHELTFDPVKARYVKVTAKPEHSMPAWHGGKGNPAFLFVDEISLN